MTCDADGHPIDVEEPKATLGNLGQWIAAVRRMMAGGVVCAGACAACGGPLLVDASRPMHLPCERCGGRAEVPAASTVAAPLHGLSCGLNATAPGKGSFQLTYSLERVEAASAGGHECPGCGAPVPPGHASDDCSYCRARLWMVDPDGRRYTYVLRMRGRRRTRPVDERVPLHRAERAIAQDVEVWRSAATMIKGVGFGLALAFAAVLIPIVIIGLAVVAFLVLGAAGR